MKPLEVRNGFIHLLCPIALIQNLAHWRTQEMQQVFFFFFLDLNLKLSLATEGNDSSLGRQS